LDLFKDQEPTCRYVAPPGGGRVTNQERRAAWISFM
jgi:hypothetical protein